MCLASKLQYSGLTWDRVKSVVVEAAGAGNVAAISTIYSWFSAYETSNLSDADKVFQFLRDKSTETGIQLSDLKDEITSAITNNLKSALGQVAIGIASKFVPGAGAIRSLYQGFTWVLSNYNDMVSLVDQFLNAITSPNIRGGVLSTLNNSVPLMMSFAASQLGLSKLPTEIKAAATAIPEKFYGLLRKGVSRAFAAVPNTGAGDTTYKGIQNSYTQFQHDGIWYRLWAADDKVAKIRIARQEANGSWKMIKELVVTDFKDGIQFMEARNAFNALVSATQNLVTASAVQKQTAKPPAGQTGNPPPNNGPKLTTMAAAQATLATAQAAVVAQIKLHACPLECDQADA